jgi:hypothetical protein
MGWQRQWRGLCESHPHAGEITVSRRAITPRSSRTEGGNEEALFAGPFQLWSGLRNSHRLIHPGQAESMSLESLWAARRPSIFRFSLSHEVSAWRSSLSAWGALAPAKGDGVCLEHGASEVSLEAVRRAVATSAADGGRAARDPGTN